MTRRLAEQVADDHIRRAVAAAKPSLEPVGHFADDSTALHLPKRPTRTQEQKARSDALDAIERHKAATRIAEILMLLAHGCRGKSCRSRRHAADRDRYGGREEGGEGMHALLAMLDLEDAIQHPPGLPP